MILIISFENLDNTIIHLTFFIYPANKANHNASMNHQA